MKRNQLVLFLILAGIFWGNAAVQAFPSLDSQDIVGDILITVQGAKEQVPVVRDHEKRELFYYLPARARLAMDNGKPVFHLLRYQRKKAPGSSELVEGAILQFAVSLALPDDAMDSLKQEVGKRFGVDKGKVNLMPLPLKSCRMGVYSPKGDLLGDAPQFPQIAPTFVTQMIPVQIKLNTLGADVVDELVNGNTGIPVVFDFEYDGITPTAGFKATVDWAQCHSHLSANFDRSVSGCIKVVGIAVNMNQSMAAELFLQKKSVKVESLAGEAMDAATIQKYVEMVVEKIMNEITEVKIPAQVEPISTKAGVPLGLGVGAGIGMKAIQTIKKGKTTYSMNQRMMVARQGVVGGFIGIGALPKEARDTLVTMLPPGDWPNAYFPLPDPGDASALGVSSIDLSVRIVDKSGKEFGNDGPRGESARWSASTGLWKRGQNEVDSFLFPMMSLNNKLKTKINTIQFALDYQITYKSGGRPTVYRGKVLMPVFNGDFPTPSPLALVDVISVYNSFSFGVPEAKIAAASVKCDVVIDGKKTSQVIQLQNNDPQYLLIDQVSGTKVTPIKTTVTLQPKSGKPLNIVFDDLRDLGNTIALGDWNLE